MQELKAKLEIMELYSMYLLYLDERKFDNNSFSRLFTENAEMRAPSKMHSFNVCGEHEATFSNWNSDFTVIFSDVGWRIQSLNVKMKYTYNFSISSEDQELFL